MLFWLKLIFKSFFVLDTLDRTFNYLYSDQGFTRGNHVLRFTAGNVAPQPVILQLCNYEITEYGPSNRYNMQEYVTLSLATHALTLFL